MTGYLYRGNPALEEMNARILAARTDPAEMTQRRIDGQKKARPSKMARPLPMVDPPAHGTRRRYDWDRRRGIEPCDDCKAGKTAEKRAQREAARASGGRPAA